MNFDVLDYLRSQFNNPYKSFFATWYVLVIMSLTIWACATYPHVVGLIVRGTLVGIALLIALLTIFFVIWKIVDEFHDPL